MTQLRLKVRGLWKILSPDTVRLSSDDGRLVSHGDLFRRSLESFPLFRVPHEGNSSDNIKAKTDPGQDEGVAVALRCLPRVGIRQALPDMRKWADQHLDHNQYRQGYKRTNNLINLMLEFFPNVR